MGTVEIITLQSAPTIDKRNGKPLREINHGTTYAYIKRKCRCRVCVEARRKYKKAMREKHKESSLAAERRTYHKNKHANSEKRRAYYLKNQSRIKKKTRMYYKEHKEEVKTREQKYAESHREHVREYKKKYRTSEAGKISEIAARHRRRSRLLLATGHSNGEQIIGRINLYGGMCYLCKNKRATALDHVIPLTRGGTNWASNLRPVCKSCNSRKGNKTLAEYKEWLRANHTTI